jgi:Putative auto-transporter adhesin, head GIN domain
MKKYISLFLFLSSITLGFGQKHDDITTEQSEIKDFTKVDISLAAKVRIRQSDTFRYKIEGQQRHLDEIEASVKNGVLRIRLREKRNWLDGIERVTITIEAPKFEALDFSGAGELIADNTLTGDSLSIDVSGAGSMVLNKVDYQSVNIDLSGVGNISIGGKAVSATMEMSGTGNIDAFDLTADTVRCETSGVGNINCFANETLTASVSGIGGVRYKGTPKNLRKSVSGIGKVVNRN